MISLGTDGDDQDYEVPGRWDVNDRDVELFMARHDAEMNVFGENPIEVALKGFLDDLFDRTNEGAPQRLECFVLCDNYRDKFLHAFGFCWDLEYAERIATALTGVAMQVQSRADSTPQSVKRETIS